VTAHHGWVEVESHPDAGTTFRVLLPVVDEGQIQGVAPTSGGDAEGAETVLVADDEPGIRRLVRIGLESRGYSVIEACDGDDALLRWREHRDEVDAVVLDLTMPGRDGLAVRRAILAEVPGLPILITSGNLLDRPSEVIDFLCKPFKLDELAARLREVIGRKAGPVD
jgi:DNA-binding response OmpR family regulator